MKSKIVSFKFTKKQNEIKGKKASAKKNYENIFIDILSGVKIEKKSKPGTQREKNQKTSLSKNKKNIIKFISKLEKSKINEDLNHNSKNLNIIEEIEKNKENDLNIKEKLIKTINNNEKIINITDNNIINKERKRTDIIEDYMYNKSKEISNFKSKIELKEKYSTEHNKTKEQEILLLLNQKDNQGFTLYNNNKHHNYIKSVKTMKNDINNNKLNIKKRELINNKNKIKNNIKENSKVNLYDRNSSHNNKYNTNSFQQKRIFNKEKEIKNNKTKTCRENNLSLNKKNYSVYNKQKVRENNKTFDKLILKNNNKKNNNYKDYISIKDTIKKKRLILNNTNNNINININITNINDKDSNKEISHSIQSKKSKLNTENNYNNNITTVNIINNNNNISKKFSSNDYRLLLYNHSNNKYLPYQTKISSKGIKIESIDINLSEENPSPNKKKQKYKFRKNLKKNNVNQNYKNLLESIEKKEVQSEYEHFRDMEDFCSNKSSNSYSCKSGFTATRKLRSLSREREKFKMMNNLKNYDKDKIDKIEDKLINIVNKFHNDNSTNNMNKKLNAGKAWKIKRKHLNIDN